MHPPKLLNAAKSSWQVMPASGKGIPSAIKAIALPTDEMEEDLPEKTRQELKAAMALALSRAANKFIFNNEGSCRLEKQCCHHFYVTNEFGATWMLNVIIGSQVYVQSPLISSTSFTKNNIDLKMGQIDHATAEWDSANGRLRNLHLTSIRDIDGPFDKDKGIAEYEPNLIIDPAIISETLLQPNDAQNFVRLTLTEQTLRFAHGYTHNLPIGSSNPSLRAAGMLLTTLPPDMDINETALKLNDNLTHVHHLLKFHPDHKWNGNDAISIVCLAGSISHSPFPVNSKNSFQAENLNKTTPSPTILNHESNQEIPDGVSLEISWNWNPIKNNFVSDPSQILPLLLMNENGLPFFYFSVPTPEERYENEKPEDISDISEIKRYLQTIPDLKFEQPITDEELILINDSWGPPHMRKTKKGVTQDVRLFEFDDNSTIWVFSCERDGNTFAIANTHSKPLRKLNQTQRKVIVPKIHTLLKRLLELRNVKPNRSPSSKIK